MLGLVLVNSINSLVVGGFKGFSISLFFLLAGSLLGGYWFEFEFNKDSTVIPQGKIMNINCPIDV